MRRAQRGLLRTAAVSLAAIAIGPVGTVIAAPPSVTITSPLNGSISNDRTPSFSGLAEPSAGEVTLKLYSGRTPEGTPIQEMKTALFTDDGVWRLGHAKRLEDGSYTAQASQTIGSESGMSAPVTFTVDTAAPTVTLNSPESPSDNPTPSFTGTAGDTTPVTVEIHAGATPNGTLLSTATATGTGGAWKSDDASPPLASGQYTAVATQESSLGNPTGESEPVTFTVTPPPPVTVSPLIAPAVLPAPASPTASFKWFPSVPVAGQPVLLMSSSTDAASQITATAWALTANGPFQEAGAVFITSFSTPGAHVVRLRVTNAYGLSSIAAATIEVASAEIPLMQPFPVVRIVGTESGSGVKLKLLRVQQTPTGARITVRCRGHGCPTKSARAVTVASRRGVVPVDFPGFERSLRFGVTLEIFVSKPGEIGKYTRFAIRRGRLPERVDMCLDEAGNKPLVCPQS